MRTYICIIALLCALVIAACFYAGTRIKPAPVITPTLQERLAEPREPGRNEIRGTETMGIIIYAAED